MLRFDSVHFAYGSRVALAGVTTEFLGGKVTAIIGANGSGKSTLLKLAARVIDPLRGAVLLEGKDATAWGRKAYARRIGYLPQELDVPFPMRAIDVVLSGRSMHLSRWEWESELDLRRADEALETCDAVELRDRLMFEMSGGERKRVLLARVLAGDPDVVLLDEPLASLDVAHMQQLAALMRRLAAAQRSVVFVSHDFNWAAACADRIIAMSGGRIVAEGSATAVLVEKTLREHFGFDGEVITRAARPWVVPRVETE